MIHQGPMSAFPLLLGRVGSDASTPSVLCADETVKPRQRLVVKRHLLALPGKGSAGPDRLFARAPSSVGTTAAATSSTAA